jgi:hypothetical protein
MTPSGLGTSIEASQVCEMNSTPATRSAPAIARPICRASSRFSSASIEMPSKPRKDSMPMATAAKISDQPNVSPLNSAVAAPIPLPLPCARPTAKKISTRARTTSSAIRNIIVVRAVILMPR